MTIDSNTVNIKNRPYHHGDLRSALIAEGLRLLATRDADALSLREVARGAGVSATSVYRHFPDKEALMAALATEGLKLLGMEQARAGAAAGGGGAGFAATGRAYVRFALANPALFRLIFTTPVMGYDDLAQRAAQTEAGTMLLANAVRAAEQSGGEAKVRAVQAWALVHGLAMLMLDGQLPADQQLIDLVVVEPP